jgi:hypothetical protein
VARKVREAARVAKAQAQVRAAKVPAAVTVQARGRKALGAVTVARKAVIVARNTPAGTITKFIAPEAGRAEAIEAAAEFVSSR